MYYQFCSNACGVCDLEEFGYRSDHFYQNLIYCIFGMSWNLQKLSIKSASAASIYEQSLELLWETLREHFSVSFVQNYRHILYNQKPKGLSIILFYAYVSLCATLQSILNLIRTRTHTFNACALYQIAIPLLAQRARREQLWKLQCDEGHGRKTHRSPVSTAERLAVTKYSCKLPFGKPDSV